MIEPAFFVTGGTLRQDAQSYVARAADAEVLEALRAGDFCYVLTSRQMGKSSLMVRAAAQLRAERLAVVVLDLTGVGQNLDVEQWYFSMLTRVGDQVHLEDELEAYWEAHQREAPLQRFMGAIRDVYLDNGRRKPLVIFVDEIDYVRSLQKFSADEFFAGIRECYNRRPEDQKLRRLTFCLLGVATPSDLIRDQRMTPFNIGRGIELHDFTADEAQVLADGLSPHRETAHLLLERVLSWTSGHPYLTQKLCAEVVKAGAHDVAAVDRVCGEVYLSAQARERDDNLHFVRERVLHSVIDRAALLDAYAKVCRGERVAADHLNPVINELRLSGIVRVVDGFLKVRNQIYARVFDRKWVRDNLPDAERQRQRDAFRRGVRRVVGYSLTVVIILGVLALYALKQKRRAIEALDEKTNALTEKSRALEKATTAEKNAAEAARKAAAAAKNEAEAATLAKKEADRAREGEKQAELSAEEARAAHQQVTVNFVENQKRVTRLLDAASPLLGSQSASREKFLEYAKALHEDVSPEAAKLPEVRMGQADLLRVYSRLYGKLGKQAVAKEHAEEARRIITECLQQDPQSSELNRRVVESENAIGDAILGERDVENLKRKSDPELQQAIDAYQRALDHAQKLREQDPANREWQRAAFASFNNIGDVQFRLNHDDEALESFQSARQLIEDLQKKNPEDPELRESLAMSHDRIGDLYYRQRNFRGAREEFGQSFALREKLHSEAAENVARINGLAISYNKLGKYWDAADNREKALENYQASLNLREKLVKSDPRNFEWKRNLSFSYNNVASIWNQTHHEKDAKEYFEKRLSIARDLYNEDPTNPDWRNDYPEALNRLADFLLNVKDVSLRQPGEALNYSREAVKLTNKKEPRFLGTAAQAERISGSLEAGKQFLDLAFNCLPPEGSRTPEEAELAKGLRMEQDAAARDGKRRPQTVSVPAKQRGRH